MSADAEALRQIAALIAFSLLMLLINLKAGDGRHWSSSLLTQVTYWLLVGAVCLLAWRVAEVVL